MPIPRIVPMCFTGLAIVLYLIGAILTVLANRCWTSINCTVDSWYNLAVGSRAAFGIGGTCTLISIVLWILVVTQQRRTVVPPVQSMNMNPTPGYMEQGYVPQQEVKPMLGGGGAQGQYAPVAYGRGMNEGERGDLESELERRKLDLCFFDFLLL